MATKDTNKHNFLGAIAGLGVIAILIIAGVYFLDIFPSDTSDETAPTPTEYKEQTRVSLVLDRLPLSSDNYYEIWIQPNGINDTDKISVGTFRVTEDGLYSLDGEPIINNEFLIQEDLGDVDGMMYVTVHTNDTVETDSDSPVIMEGQLQQGIGAIEFFQSDLENVSGEFILATPSDGPNTNETSGVWFVTVTDTGEVAGLTIPMAPEGWIYEAWVKSGTQLLSIGQFRSNDETDTFSVYTPEAIVPAFPGEDFLINPPLDVEFPLELAQTDTEVLITLEPEFKSVGDPTFGITLLNASLSETSPAGEAIQLVTVAKDNMPSGLVIIRR